MGTCYIDEVSDVIDVLQRSKDMAQLIAENDRMLFLLTMSCDQNLLFSCGCLGVSDACMEQEYSNVNAYVWVCKSQVFTFTPQSITCKCFGQ